jgi:hypothetical protein
MMMWADMSSAKKRHLALAELVDRFGSDAYSARPHNFATIGQSCFQTDNRLFHVHLMGDGAVNNLVSLELQTVFNREAVYLNECFPGSPIDIVVEHTSHPIRTGRAADGRVSCVAKGTRLDPIYIQIRTNFPHPSRNVLHDIASTLRHEYHHYRLFERGHRVDRLIDQMIYEGLAIAFELELAPLDPPLYATWASREQLRRLWLQAKPVLYESGLYREWMFGNGTVPRWSGYALGFELVSSYMRHHPDIGVSKLMDVPAEDYIRFTWLLD